MTKVVDREYIFILEEKIKIEKEMKKRHPRVF